MIHVLESVFSTIFWSFWIVSFTSVFILLMLGLKLPTVSRLEWWQGPSPIYQIYPKSFQDSNGDGIGDLKGIQKRLGYLQRLGIKTVWLSPIYQSPMKDNGYDISNFKQVDPVFGTLEDFKSLVGDMKSKDMKLLMDFVVNHTSDQHEWFQKSVKRIPPYSDYYVWSDPMRGTKDQPPNNWLSVFGGSAWTFNKQRKQFYLHQFFPEQPDLNLRSTAVRNEILDIFRFWMDEGVHGFRLDAIKHGFEDMNFDGKNEPSRPGFRESRTVAGADRNYDSLLHIHTTNQPETFPLLREWRKFLDVHSQKDGVPRVMVSEVYDDPNVVAKYFGIDSFDQLSHFPFNFNLLTDINNDNISGFLMRDSVLKWISRVPPHGWNNWVVGNHDNGRIRSRFDEKIVDAMNMIVILLPGTPVTYYGEELGLADGPEADDAQARDPMGRDVARGPMPWDDTKNAGFCSNKAPWLPLGTDHRTSNVKAQLASQSSHFSVYSALVKLRAQSVFKFGGILLPDATKQIFWFLRHLKGHRSYLIAANVSQQTAEINFRDSNEKGFFRRPPIVTEAGTIVLRSSADVRRRSSVDLRKPVTLQPHEGVVIRLALKLS
ncbi:unnamed protein product [Notodromas monacha]|uniref:alpha-glucosidase n=1 Tax=Notodromas monacha TaxID=399045 RepID=A0A7R9G9L7_9CRUS|nr:unnamed protein product [Notodromas monacha]CAG0912742.1 unnamed protein product [Notodromas monacha]